MPRPLLGVSGALLLALLAGWLWGASGHADLERALRASELRDDLREAHASILGARVELDERDFSSASRHLENARGLLRRAEERGQRLGWRDEVTRLDLARFEAEIDLAQRLLGQLDPGASPLVPERQALFEGTSAAPQADDTSARQPDGR